MKNQILKSALFVAFLFMAVASQANPFVDSLNQIRDEWIRPAYPIIIGIVFLVGILSNLGSLFGENRDIKKVVVSILIYLGICLTVVGVYEALTAIVV